MAAVKRKVRRLERFRKVHKAPIVAERQGSGKAQAREAKAVAIKAALALRKKSNKLVSELDALDIDALKSQLTETRQELFNLRFKHATAQLQNVSLIQSTKRRVARILTLIKQKEVGA